MHVQKVMQQSPVLAPGSVMAWLQVHSNGQVA